ncbi:MAG TPA: protein kinase [Cellvibrio sp.]
MIKHYQIVSCLGQGGFGKVFEAWDSKLQRSVAIKCLDVDGLLSPATDLLREARMAASLNHPAFVKIHALEDDDNSQAIVMELIKGETLKQVIVNQLGATQSCATRSGVTRSGVTQAIGIIRQIAEAMQQAHELGLTHGDLKPSNIMLEPSGAIRILDFGLASKVDAQATTSMLQQDPQGTIAYMAPERLLGAPLAPSIDVYALGVIFFELLNGQRPFADLSGLALAAALVQSSSDQWNYSAELSPSLIHLIRRMTAKQAGQRLSSMVEVLDQLDAFKNGVLLENKSLPPEIVIASESKTEPPKQLRNKQLQNAVLLSLVVIGCVVFGGWITRNYLWRFEEVIPRYSESQEMKLGMDALEQWDRPGSLDAAIKHFNNLAEQNPENAAAIAGLSIAYHLRYQSDREDELWQQKAFASAEQAIKLNPDLAISQIALGFALLGQGNPEKAVVASELALSLDPNNIFSWLLKAKILNKLEKTAEAIQFAELALKKFPDHQTFTDLIGSIYTDLGQYSDAERAFKASIEIQPDSIYSYANLSVVLLEQGRTDEALSVIQRGLQIKPNAWLYTNLGTLYFYKGQYLAAAEAFEKAVAPSYGGAMEYQNWINLADTLLWIPGRKHEADKCYRKAISLLKPIITRNPADAELASKMAVYRARVGDMEISKSLLATLVQKPVSSPAIIFRVGLAYELIGERAKALERITKAHELGYPIFLIESDPDLESLRRDNQYSLR